MSARAPIEYRAISSIRGPLIVVQDVSGVGWDETAQVTLESGEVRHGTVLDVHRDLAVVEILEGTSGMRLDSARVAFTGAPMRIPGMSRWRPMTWAMSRIGTPSSATAWDAVPPYPRGASPRDMSAIEEGIKSHGTFLKALASYRRHQIRVRELVRSTQAARSSRTR